MEGEVRKFIDLSGQKFGRLTALSLSNPARYKGSTYWDCRCDCGKIVSVRAGHLKSGYTKSCGCLFEEFMSDRNPAPTISEEKRRAIELTEIVPNNQLALRLKVSQNTVRKYKELSQ